MGAAALGLGLTQGFLHLLGLLSGGLLALAVYSLLRPSDKANFTLFKYASLYMMLSMLLIAVTAFKDKTTTETQSTQRILRKRENNPQIGDSVHRSWIFTEENKICVICG